MFMKLLYMYAKKKNSFLLVEELLLVTELKKHLYLTRIKNIYRVRCIFLTRSCRNSKVISFQFTFINMSSEVGKNVKSKLILELPIKKSQFNLLKSQTPTFSVTPKAKER